MVQLIDLNGKLSRIRCTLAAATGHVSVVLTRSYVSDVIGEVDNKACPIVVSVFKRASHTTAPTLPMRRNIRTI